MLKTPCRADRDTETVASVHSLAAARLERAAKWRRDMIYIFENWNQDCYEIIYCMNWKRVIGLLYSSVLVLKPRPWFRVCILYIILHRGSHRQDQW